MTIRYSGLIFDSLSCQIVKYNDLIWSLRLQDDSQSSAIIFRYGKTFLYLPPSHGGFKPYILNRAIYHTTPSQRASRQNLENKGFIFHAMHRWQPLMLMLPHRWIAPALCMRVIPYFFLKDFKMSSVHIRKRITFFLVNFLQYFIVRVLEEWYSAAIPHKRTWAQQRLYGTDCPHLCSQQRGTKPGTSTVRTKPQMITWTVAVISLWLSSWKLINRVSEARWSVCLPPASHLKNDNRVQQMFYNHPSLTNALVRNQKIINYKKQTLLKLIDCQTSICWNVKINGYIKKLMNKKSFSMLIFSWMYYHKIGLSFRRKENEINLMHKVWHHGCGKSHSFLCVVNKRKVPVEDKIVCKHQPNFQS